MHVPAVTVRYMCLHAGLCLDVTLCFKDWDNILVLLQQTNEEAEDEDQADAADTHLTPSEELELIKFLIAAADAGGNSLSTFLLRFASLESADRHVLRPCKHV